MTNSPFDLEALGRDVKSGKRSEYPKHCVQPVPLENQRSREDCRRRWIASLVALLICLAVVVVIIGLVKGLPVRHKLKEIRCNVPGAQCRSSSLGSVVGRFHARHPKKGGHTRERTASRYVRV